MDDASKAVRMFIAATDAEAMSYAKQLHSDNSERKQADSAITREAVELVRQQPDCASRRSTVVYQPHWHKGVVGIVASRLIEQYYRPTIVLTRSGDVVAGSARSVPGFNLYEAIHACREYLLGYGGHFAAAGLSMDPDQVEPFREAFEAEVARTIDPSMLTPEIRIDAELRLDEIQPAFYRILGQMEPFGPENQLPQFVVRGVRDTGRSQVVKEQHLRVSIRQGKSVITGIGFGLAEKYPLLKDGKPVDIVFHLEENHWNGNTTLEMRVADLRPGTVE
jgi:single-stranded-DNA-specific exonuclease